MLRELPSTRQIEGDQPRRWFCDETFDLIVWYDSSSFKNITGFQLCYRDHAEERALTWFKDKGFLHNRIDDGEQVPGGHKMTPLLVPDGIFDQEHVVSLFDAASIDMDEDVRGLVKRQMMQYPC